MDINILLSGFSEEVAQALRLKTDIIQAQQKIKQNQQVFNEISPKLITSLSDEILTRDFKDCERNFLLQKGIDRRFKEYNLLESLLIRSRILDLSFTFQLIYFNTYIRVPRSKLKHMVADYYDDVQVKNFFHDMNACVEDIFRFKVQEYTKTNKALAISIVFKPKRVS